MLALSPLFSCNGRWPFEDPITYHHGDEQINLHHRDQYNYQPKPPSNQSVDIYDHQYNYQLKPPCNQAVDNYYNAPTAPQAAPDILHSHEVYNNNKTYGIGDDDDDDERIEQLYSPQSKSINVGVENVDPATRKQNHNASERDRRKKLSDLYTSLRDLLPRSGHHAKKLSTPETVSRALKYIPELQQEVETLIKKKAKLSPNIFDVSLNSEGRRNGQELMNRRKRRRNGVVAHDDDQQERESSSVSANQLGANEIVVQMSTDHKNSVAMSQVLMQLENDGFNVLSVASSESFGGRIFHNLQLWVEGANAVKCGWLTDKIISLYEN